MNAAAITSCQARQWRFQNALEEKNADEAIRQFALAFEESAATACIDKDGRPKTVPHDCWKKCRSKIKKLTPIAAPILKGEAAVILLCLYASRLSVSVGMSNSSVGCKAFIGNLSPSNVVELKQLETNANSSGSKSVVLMALNMVFNIGYSCSLEFLSQQLCPLQSMSNRFTCNSKSL